MMIDNCNKAAGVAGAIMVAEEVFLVQFRCFDCYLSNIVALLPS